MVVKHVYKYEEAFFEEEVQKVINEVLLEKGCFMKLVDIKYSAACDPQGAVNYSALLMFS